VAVVDLRDRIAHRLHEAVDQRGRQVGAGRRLDAPGRDEALLQRPQEAALPLGAARQPLSACASARATRWCTCSAESSSPLAYFSFSTSALMGWAGSAAAAVEGWTCGWGMRCLRVRPGILRRAA
jgi:hypothetical protein